MRVHGICDCSHQLVGPIHLHPETLSGVARREMGVGAIPYVLSSRTPSGLLRCIKRCIQSKGVVVAMLCPSVCVVRSVKAVAGMFMLVGRVVWLWAAYSAFHILHFRFRSFHWFICIRYLELRSSYG